MLPVFNEASVIDRVLDDVMAFGAANPAYWFVLVDDGSSDRTADIIEERLALAFACDGNRRQRVQVVRCAVNAGKGIAVLRGVQTAVARNPEYVLFTDGDLAYSLDHLPRLVAALADADVVIGTRRAKDAEYRAGPARNLMGWTYNRLARACLGADYSDTQAGLKGFRLAAAKRVFSELRVTGFAFDVEVLYIARRFGYSVAEVPAVVSREHKSLGSNVNLWREPRRMFASLAEIRLNGMLGRYEDRSGGRLPISLLSFDAEEFDLPREYGQDMSWREQLDVGIEGLSRALRVLDDTAIRATFFVTANLAEACPEIVRGAARDGHEIASHAASHSAYDPGDLADSRRRIETVTGCSVKGFRRPRFALTPTSELRAAGYSYDSSSHPTWIPGRYNGFMNPRGVHDRQGVVEIPPSVTPLVRFPLFWLSFKNLPGWAYRTATRWVLASDNCAAFCFHPWELCDLDQYRIPRYTKRISGRRMSDRLTRFLHWMARRSEFVTYGEAEHRFHAGGWPFGDAAYVPGAHTRSVTPLSTAAADVPDVVIRRSAGQARTSTHEYTGV